MKENIYLKLYKTHLVSLNFNFFLGHLIASVSWVMSGTGSAARRREGSQARGGGSECSDVLKGGGLGHANVLEPGGL